jgi:putative endonuclease
MNLEGRLREHNAGKVSATRAHKPWKILRIESVGSIAEAKNKERYWKSGAGRRKIKKIFGGSRPTFYRKLGEARSNPEV